MRAIYTFVLICSFLSLPAAAQTFSFPAKPVAADATQVKLKSSVMPKYSICRSDKIVIGDISLKHPGTFRVDSFGKGSDTALVSQFCGPTQNFLETRTSVFELNDPKDIYSPGDLILEVNPDFVFSCTYTADDFRNFSRDYFWDRMKFAKDEGAGKMDYSACTIILNLESGDTQGEIDTTFFQGWMIGHKIYNNKDKGNYMWGCGMAKLDIPLFIAKLGAHYNDFMNACSQNPGFQEALEDICFSANPTVNPCTLENLAKRNIPAEVKTADVMKYCAFDRHWQLDSPIDQQAIADGYHYCKNVKAPAGQTGK